MAEQKRTGQQPKEKTIKSGEHPIETGVKGAKANAEKLPQERRDCNAMDLTGDKKAIKVYKLPVVLHYEIALSDQLVQTKEGPVNCEAGAVILTGTQGEQWPMPKERFDATYDAEVQGAGTCSKKKIEVLARQMEEPFTVKPSWSNDPLNGEPGDWLVQYGKGDMGVVGQKIFSDTYQHV